MASPTLAAAGPVLPHNDIESKQLADRASHLNLTATSSSSDASPAPPPQGGIPSPSHTRSRTCSACSKPTAEAAPLRARDADAEAPADAQHAQPQSQEHACEDKSVMVAAPSAGGNEKVCHGKHPAGAFLPLVQTGASLADLPNEVLLHILGYLDVSDLLLLSRVSGCAHVVLCSVWYLPVVVSCYIPFLRVRESYCAITLPQGSTAAQHIEQPCSTSTKPSMPISFQLHLTSLSL